jgi:dihydroflavonol-4-reductase
MLIAVTGGTGFLGAHTVARLLAGGHRVRLLARDPARVPAALGPLCPDLSTVDVVAGDVTDAGAATRLVSGAEAVLHAAGVYTFDSRRRRELGRVNEHGTEVVLEAARRAGVGHVVHVSTVGTFFPAADGHVGPGSPLTGTGEAYLASKTAAERVARRHRAAGLPVTVTHPPALLGPHDPHLGDQNARLRNLLRGLMPFWPSGGLPVGDVRDAAEQHAVLLGGPPGRSDVFGPGHFLRTREYLAVVRAVTGRRLPALFLPAAAMAPVGRLADLLQRAWPWPIPAEYGAIHVCAVAAPVVPGAPGGGVAARPSAETVRAAVAWLHEAGLVTGRQAGAARKTSKEDSDPVVPGPSGSRRP